MRYLILLPLLSASMTFQVCAELVTFENLTFFSSTGPTGSFYNGDSGIGTNTLGWSTGGVFFNNNFSPDFGGIWSGWSYSNVVDPTTPGFGNQYASQPGGGSASGAVAPGQNYAVAFGLAPGEAYFDVPLGSVLVSADVTNTTYAARSMAVGDSFAKKFGGATGNDADFFRVTFTGFSGTGLTGSTIGSRTVTLADFTFSDNAQDFILTQWQNVDLSAIGAARSVGLSFESSDVGIFGINTPTFLALDNLLFAAIPEPSALVACGVAGVLGAILRRTRRAIRNLISRKDVDAEAPGR